MLVLACKKKDGDILLPSLPETQLMVDTVNLPINSRLVTRVRLTWTGSSSNGYVKGYRIFYSYRPISNVLDSLATKPLTSRTDSTFRFAITPTDSTIFFYVQAVDNNNQSDPYPAHLRLPLRNSPPNLSITKDDILNNLDSIFAVLSLSWQGSDPDGEDTWNKAEIKANNGAWVSIPKSATFLTLLAENPKQMGIGNALIYRGQSPVLLTTGINGTGTAIKLPGWNVGGLNKIYMRARDISGAVSATDSTPHSYFIKQQKADVLVINAKGPNAGSEPNYLNLFTSALQNTLPEGYDYLDCLAFGGKNQPLFPTAYFSVLLPAFNKVVFMGDNDPSINIRVKDVTQATRPQLIEAFAPGLDAYKRNGGKLFIINRLAGHNDPYKPAFNSAIFTLLPIQPFPDSLVLKFRSVRGDSLVPQAGSGYPLLQNSGGIISAVEAFSINGNAEPLYSPNPFQPVNAPSASYVYSGPNTIALRQRADNGKVNLVYSAARLEFYNSNNGINTLFNKVLNDDFNW